ncbi:hypothetical protein K0M31_007232 [Melipona bicolor]|uniref:Uncharacterized protein n=1 Tax=Melipona bicolor TaxID=60889 RepID=A0AA40KVQ5_9HYME|nr:hypothetical protein K0M31_007232 [Melipona bicolor]
MSEIRVVEFLNIRGIGSKKWMENVDKRRLRSKNVLYDVTACLRFMVEVRNGAGTGGGSSLTIARPTVDHVSNRPWKSTKPLLCSRFLDDPESASLGHMSKTRR